MDELDKKVSEEMEANTCASEEAVTPKACEEQESPAEAVSEATDRMQPEGQEKEPACDADVCAEQESPAESLSEATDALQPDSQESASAAETEEPQRNVHTMSKEELVASMKEILDGDKMESHREVTAMKQAFFALRNRERMDELNAYVDGGGNPEGFVSQPDMLENEFNALYAQFKERRQAYLAADEARRIANLERKRDILARMREISGDIDSVNVHFSEFQQLQQEFRAEKDVPATAETEIWKEFQTVSDEYYDHLNMNKELRDLDFRKNLEAKRSLVDQARALSEVSDPVLAFRKLQTLHDEWRNIGPVAKDVRESLWEEFREASAAVNRRHQEHFEQRKAQEKANEEGKTAICEEVESYDWSGCNNYAAWNQMTDKIIALQKKWKEYGYASKKANTALYNRFRAVCDRFFEAKTEFFQKTRESFSENLARKIALCERAEALKDNVEVKNPIDEIVKLQTEWKSIGSVPRKQSDEVWHRFTAACNYFFDERKRQNKERRREENANLEAKRAIIANLKALPLDGDRREVIGKVKELQAEWNNIGFVPMKLKDEIFKEYREICDTLYNTYTQRESTRRMNNWQERVGKMRDDDRKLNSEQDKLYRALEARRNELNTYENNLGFFNVKSSAGNSMVKELERKISRLRDDIAEIETKIRMINNPAPTPDAAEAPEDQNKDE